MRAVECRLLEVSRSKLSNACAFRFNEAFLKRMELVAGRNDFSRKIFQPSRSSKVFGRFDDEVRAGAGSAGVPACRLSLHAAGGDCF